MSTDPKSELTAAIYDALASFQQTAQLSSLQHAQMRQYLAEHLADALTLRMGVEPTPETVRAAAFAEAANAVAELRDTTDVNVAEYQRYDFRQRVALGDAIGKLRRMADGAQPSE